MTKDERYVNALQFVSEKEGEKYRAYSDAPAGGKGAMTIGIGFNMDRSGAKADLARIGIDEKRYDALRNKGAELTEEEFQKIADLVIGEARELVESKIKVDLTEKQHTALVSMGVNAKALIGPKLTAAVNSGNYHAALDEILFNSGTRKNPKLMKRRYDEAKLYAEGTGVTLPSWDEYQSGRVKKVPR